MYQHICSAAHFIYHNFRGLLGGGGGKLMKLMDSPEWPLHLLAAVAARPVAPRREKNYIRARRRRPFHAPNLIRARARRSGSS